MELKFNCDGCGSALPALESPGAAIESLAAYLSARKRGVTVWNKEAANSPGHKTEAQIVSGFLKRARELRERADRSSSGDDRALLLKAAQIYEYLAEVEH